MTNLARLTISVALLVAACVDRWPLDGRRCPCATGWVCCGGEICVPAASECPRCIDLDGDRYGAGCARGEDCDDTDPEISPAHLEGPPSHATCTDGSDNDCDGEIDSADLSCRATEIFRSVGPGRSTPVATGADNPMEITGRTASFAAPLPDDLGAGDVIEYDSDGDTTVDTVAFVHRRLPDGRLLLADARGDSPPSTNAPDRQWSVLRAYTSVADAEAGVENDAIAVALRNFDDFLDGRDLSGNNEVWTLLVFADAPDTVPVIIDGWSMSPADGNCLHIQAAEKPHEVGVSQRHSGAWTPGAATLVNDGYDGVIMVRDSCVRIRGLQIEQTRINGNGQGIGFESVDDLDLTVSHCIIRSSGSSTDAYAGGVAGHGGMALRVFNNVIYDFWRGITVASLTAGCSVMLYNNSLFDVGDAGIEVTSYDTAGLAYRVKNNLVQSTGAAGFFVKGAETGDYAGNITSDATSPNAALRDVVVEVVDRVGDDFHLSPEEMMARDAGVNLSADPSLRFLDDVDGEQRGISWDIGADELL